MGVQARAACIHERALALLCFLWGWTLCMYVDLSAALTRWLDIDKAAVRLSSGLGSMMDAWRLMLRYFWEMDV